MTKIYIALAFVIGTAFSYSLIGEYARYGKAIYQEIEECELEAKECDYIIAPVSKVTFGPASSSHHALYGIFLGQLHQTELNPNQDTKA